MKKLTPVQIWGIVLAVATVSAVAFTILDGTPVQPTRFTIYENSLPPQRCPVENSSDDNSVFQVNEWFKDNLDDPKSLELVGWSKVRMTDDSLGYFVMCRYRANNQFGAKVLQSKIFNLDLHGTVTRVTDSDWGAAKF
jgi:hypothetical protein